MQPRLRLAAFYGIFFLSGIGGLSYQVVWSRMFAAGLGHELPAVLAVVAAFFGGLALGAWLLDGAVSRSHHPGRWYAALELVIGLWGALSILLIPRMNVLAAGLIGIDATPVRHWTVAFALPLLALLPATASMGATLPAMERCVAPLLADRKCVGALYGLNTLGAVAGALACTFLVAPALGFRGTVLVLVGLNLLCGLFVWGMEFRVVSPAEHAKSTPEPVVSRGLYPALFVTGLLGIGFEVLGVRAL